MISYLIIFSFIRILILLILEKLSFGNSLYDIDKTKTLAVFYIFIILCITLIYYQTYKSWYDSILNALLLNSISTGGSELLMFIIPLISKIIPPLGLFLDGILMFPFVSTVISGILWLLFTFIGHIIIILFNSTQFFKKFKIAAIIIIIIFNYIVDKLNFIKSFKKKGLKTLFKMNKLKKLIKNPTKLIKKGKKYAKNNVKNNAQNAQDYAQDYAEDYAQDYAYNYGENAYNYEQNAYNYGKDYGNY